MVNDGLWSAMLFLGLAIFLCVAGIGISILISPHYHASRERNTTFECGVDTEGSAWVQFKISYFLYALVFLLFDIETIFFYPVAIIFRDIGLLPLIGSTVFLIILCIGLWYEWKEGALEWK